MAVLDIHDFDLYSAPATEWCIKSVNYRFSFKNAICIRQMLPSNIFVRKRSDMEWPVDPTGAINARRVGRLAASR